MFVFHSTLLETYPENYFVRQCFKIFLLTFLLAASKFVVFHLGLCSVVSLLLYNVKNENRKSLYITWETGFLSIICRKKNGFVLYIFGNFVYKLWNVDKGRFLVSHPVTNEAWPCLTSDIKHIQGSFCPKTMREILCSNTLVYVYVLIIILFGLLWIYIMSWSQVFVYLNQSGLGTSWSVISFIFSCCGLL